MTDETLENMRTTGLRTKLKEVIGCIQIGCIQKCIQNKMKIRERWAQMEQKKKRDEEVKS